MSTTFMSRAKVALIAVVATAAMAIGMTALAPVSAQAITSSNGATAFDITFTDGAVTHNGHTYQLGIDWKKFVYDDDEDSESEESDLIGAWQMNLKIDGVYQPHPVYFLATYLDQDYVRNEAKYATYTVITLKNGTTYMYAHDDDQWWGEPYMFSQDNNEVIFHVDGWRCAAPYGASISKVDGNSLVVKYNRKNDTTFKSTNSGRNFTYSYRWNFNSLTSDYNAFKRSTKTATPLSTTKWRTLAKTKTAYKSSTSNTRKFTVKAGSKVQVKKVYTGYDYIRYYVKTKSGKYGWIVGKHFEVEGA